MAGIDRHLVVLGCGLVGTATLAFVAGLATASWPVAAPAQCSAPLPPESATGSDDTEAGHSDGQQAVVGARVDARESSTAAAPLERPAPIPPAPAGGGAFRVQVGSFLDQQAAAAVAARLASRGYLASVEPRKDRTGLVWYAPVVGAYAERAVAVVAAREVAQRVGLDARVVAVAKGNAS
jgi:cell division septation protein DedD